MAPIRSVALNSYFLPEIIQNGFKQLLLIIVPASPAFVAILHIKYIAQYLDKWDILLDDSAAGKANSLQLDEDHLPCTLCCCRQII